MPFFVVLVESFYQVAEVSSDLVRVFPTESSDVEDHLSTTERLNKKRKAAKVFTNPSGARDQTEAIEDPLMVGEILVLLTPHHGLDMFKEIGIPCPSSLRASLLMNREYKCRWPNPLFPIS